MLLTFQVDEALSEDVSDSDEENPEQKSLKSLSSKEGEAVKRRSEGNDEEGTSSTKKQALEKEEENESDKSSCSAESESDDDDMAADVERQFFAL